MSHQEVIIGNSLEVLKGMNDECIDVVVTSPPYWALRDYGSEPVVWGGDAQCQHEWIEHREPARGGVGTNANVGANRDGVANNRGHPTVTNYCTKCGAWKGQLGLEPTPDEYIDHMCQIFDEVYRVLKPTGAFWLNIGDTYNGTKKGNTETNKSPKTVTDSFVKQEVEGIGSKCMCMIPERLAIALCERGWILRNKIIWHKPNQMPQSATDRFTQDYEMFYFFTKEPCGYWFNQLKDGDRTMRTVWEIPTQPSPLDHCAMFPKALIDRPIQACCPPDGIVLDPFCGSGTVLEYCFEHDIDALGIEVNPEFKDMIEKRMRKNQTRLADFDES